MKKNAISSDNALLDGPDGWKLAPEGSLIDPESATAVIADVHLGYEWARASKGDSLPAFVLLETQNKLKRLFDRHPIRNLIVAGDLVESPRPCPRAANDLKQLQDWLKQQDVTLQIVRGNHDPWWQWESSDSIPLRGWTIVHGHEPRAEPKLIMGHFHPALKAMGVNAPCFLIGPQQIILPAFSVNAAGLHVGSPSAPSAWLRMRCYATSGNALLDFGLLANLVNKLQCW